MKKNIYGENSLDFGLSLVRIAMLYDVTQRFSEALELYRTNASILEKIGKTQTDSYAKTLEGIASNLMRMGQFKEAEKYFFKELELYENNIALKKIYELSRFFESVWKYIIVKLAMEKKQKIILIKPFHLLKKYGEILHGIITDLFTF
ncbi:MAG: tetratricopeptide repeat protein [Saprospiraceae bacterium]|nr:tetratricopeptide repeat protein [Saprospiraceae bacterium]